MITGGQGRQIAWMGDDHMFDTRAIEAYRRDLIGVLDSLDDYHARAMRTAVEATVALAERQIGDRRAWLEGLPATRRGPVVGPADRAQPRASGRLLLPMPGATLKYSPSKASIRNATLLLPLRFRSGLPTR